MALNLYTMKDVCAALSLTPRTVCRYIKAGKLHPTKVGRAWLFAEDDLRSYLLSQGLDPRFVDRLGDAAGLFQKGELTAARD